MWGFFSNPTGGELFGVEKLEGELSRVGKIIREELFGKGIVWIPFFSFFMSIGKTIAHYQSSQQYKTHSHLHEQVFLSVQGDLDKWFDHLLAGGGDQVKDVDDGRTDLQLL